jgi:hypothetical protein
MFNLLTWPKQMCLDLERLGFTPILWDNGSTYKPLLDWYDNECKYEVIRNKDNAGCYWMLVQRHLMKQTEVVAYTDCDLDLSGVPDDFIARATESLNINTWSCKIGVSLEILDVPQNAITLNIMNSFERKYWINKSIDGNWLADTSTTLAIYRPGCWTQDWIGDGFYKTVRLDRPYTARHMPWYYTEKNNVDDEFRFYLANMNTHGVSSTQLKNALA